MQDNDDGFAQVARFFQDSIDSGRMMELTEVPDWEIPLVHRLFATKHGWHAMTKGLRTDKFREIRMILCGW